MMDNCSYNKIKLMHTIACADWFIEQFAKKDAAQDKTHKKCGVLYAEVQGHLDAALRLLQEAQCGAQKSVKKKA